MRQIIDGASYDTATAKMLGESTRNRREVDFCHEVLYRTKSGRYFIFGEGGPDSRYAMSAQGDGHAWIGGEKLVPLTREAAMKWTEEYLSDTQYGDIFGIPEEGFEVISVRLNAITVARLRAWCEGKNRSMTSIIEELLTGFTDANTPEEDVK